MMFTEYKKLNTLNLNGISFANVKGYEYMFNNVLSTINVVVKDNDAKTFIEARLNEENGGTVTIV